MEFSRRPSVITMLPNEERMNLKLLSLDGGGVRGLSSLFLLQQVMETIGTNPNRVPLPCEIFDMIGGTSTGGLIAIMLGHLKMSVKDCIEVYIRLMTRIFHRTHLGITRNLHAVGRYDTAALEQAIKDTIVSTGIPQDQTFRTNIDGSCKVLVCAMSSEDRQSPITFSNFARRGEEDRELYELATIWQVARATCAAPFFFDPVRIGRNGQLFGDGGVHRNNPVAEVWRLSREIWGSGQGFESHVSNFLSIGTGESGIRPFGQRPDHIVKSVIAIATETRTSNDDFINDHRPWSTSDHFLRLNVQNGLENVPLEETSATTDIRVATSNYARQPLVKEKILSFSQIFQSVVEISHASINTPQASPELQSLFPRQPSTMAQIDPDQFWNLTLEDYRLLEQAYTSIPKTLNGSVHLDTILNHFRNLKHAPTLLQVVQTVRRINPHVEHIFLTKAQFMAVLYMLRAEYFQNKAPPLTNSGDFRMSPERRGNLEAFDRWVNCACQCGRRWNFVRNSGISHFDGDPRRTCLVQDFTARLHFMPDSLSTAGRIYKATKDRWSRGIEG